MKDTEYRDKLAAWLKILWEGINPITGEPSIPEVRFISSYTFDTPGGVKAK